MKDTRTPNFGAYLKELRRVRRLTSLEVAGMLELPPELYGDIERNRKAPPKAADLGRYADALKLTVAEEAALYEVAAAQHTKASSEPNREQPCGAEDWTQIVRVALRLARERDVTAYRWGFRSTAANRRNGGEVYAGV